MALGKLGRLIAVVGLLLLLSACATTSPTVPMKTEFWSQTDRSISVVIAKLPPTRAHRAGPQGLLDIAINETLADELGKALESITLNDSYGQARSEVVKRMQERGLKASFTDTIVDVDKLEIFQAPDQSRVYAREDFRPLKATVGSDRLLVFRVTQVGTLRSYYGFVPISRPNAVLNARGEMIDLTTNEVLWRDTTSHTAATADPWDQPPEFTNVHAAVQKVIEDARREMVDKLFNSAGAK